MKRQDRLFQKSVAGKSRHIPAGYNRRIADTLNSLPDIALHVSEESTVHVITHKINYKYITAVSAAALILITGGACLHFGLSTGDGQNNNNPKTTVKFTTPIVTTSPEYGKVTEPSVTYVTTSVMNDKKTSDTQNHDVARDPEQTNNNSGNVTQENGGKGKNDAAVTENKEADKVQNSKQPQQKEPSVQDGNAEVNGIPEPVIPDVTVPVPELPGDKKDNDEKEDKKDNDKKDNIEKDKHQNKKEEPGENNPVDRPGPAGKGPLEEMPEPEHFIGGNNVRSKQADLKEPAEKEAERIQKEIQNSEKTAEKSHEQPMPCLPSVPECENEFSYPQD